MIQLQSFGILLCVVLIACCLAAFPAAREHDRHLLHKPGECPDGVCDEP